MVRTRSAGVLRAPGVEGRRVATTVGAMRGALRVNDRVSLPEVLAPLAPEALALQWSVLDLGEVVPGESWDRRVPFREPRVMDSPRGWVLTFAELVDFGEWTV
jgi:hypothetical protein